MVFTWSTCPSAIKSFIYTLNNEIKTIIHENIIGCYLHGSLALGGFNPKHSDIDLLVVTMKSLKLHEKRKLAQLFLAYSNAPFPIEISFLNQEQLKEWQHPLPFDFHYSEFWRECYEEELIKGTSESINDTIQTDPDLAAHITIINDKGLCLEGAPIQTIFPKVPRSDYVLSIMGDYRECLRNIEVAPVYCTLNMLRVFGYLQEGIIFSKQDAGYWGLKILPTQFVETVRKILHLYTGEGDSHSLSKEELVVLRDFVAKKVEQIQQSSIKEK